MRFKDDFNVNGVLLGLNIKKYIKFIILFIFDFFIFLCLFELLVLSYM